MPITDDLYYSANLLCDVNKNSSFVYRRLPTKLFPSVGIQLVDSSTVWFISMSSTCTFLPLYFLLVITHQRFSFARYKLWAFLCIWASILVLIIGVGLLSLKKQLPRVKPPIQDAEADGEVVFDTVHLTPPVGGDVFEGKKSGGSWFSPKDRVAKGEMSREKRRNLPGTKKLEDDGDSVLNSEFGSGAGAIEMDEIDRLGEDDFGDFETAEVLEIDDEDIKNKDELNPGP